MSKTTAPPAIPAQMKSHSGAMIRNLTVPAVRAKWEERINPVFWSQFRADLEDMAECFYTRGYEAAKAELERAKAKAKATR